MKKILTLFTLIALLMPHSVYAARLWTTGAEWQTTAADVEWSEGSTGTSETSPKNGGAASVELSPSAAFEWFGHDIGSASTNQKYIRFYLYVTSCPSSGTYADFATYNVTTVSRGAHIELRDDCTLAVYDDGDVMRGTASSALNTGQWYLVEWSLEGLVNPTYILKLDGVEFSNSSVGTGSSWDGFYLGSPAATATFDINVDDIALNDTTTGEQNTWIGAGKIAIAVPTGDGDSNCDSGAGDWAHIDEIPPSNTATAGGTDICELDTTTSTAYFAMTDSSTAGIDSYDTVNLVYIMTRVREETAGSANWFMSIKSASGGTASSTAVADAGDATTVRTNPNSTTPFGREKILYRDPTTNLSWTPTGTNSIDNMQCGVGSTDGTPDTWVTTFACMVEYVDGNAPASGSPNKSGIIFIDQDN